MSILLLEPISCEKVFTLSVTFKVADAPFHIHMLSRYAMMLFTLMTSQGSDTVTAIFKCNSSNTTTSLRLLKMA